MWTLVIAEPTLTVTALRSRLKTDPATIKGAFMSKRDCNLHVVVDSRRYLATLPSTAQRDKLVEDLYYACINVDYAD